MRKNYKTQMKKLQESIGSEVYVIYSSNGKTYADKTILKGVDPFESVDLIDSAMPFIGKGSAIISIIGLEGRVLYINSKIFNNYNLHDPKKIYYLKVKCFGPEDAGEKEKRPQAPIVKTSYLKELLSQDKITKGQYELIKKQANNWLGTRNYVLGVVSDANELYDLIKDVSDKETLDTIINEVDELSEHVIEDTLNYSPITKQVMTKLNEKYKPDNINYLIIRSLIDVISERKNISITLRKNKNHINYINNP